MKVLVSGASGFIGTALCEALLQRGDQVFALRHQQQSKLAGLSWIDRPEQAGVVDAVVNLAGTPIADKPWSDARKQELLASRLNTTRRLVRWIEASEQKPRVLVSGSAIGAYGAATGAQPLNEASEPLCEDFSVELCRAWEGEAVKAADYGVRVCLIRTGIVLGKGGALAKMRLPFSLGLGGPVATGRQAMPWIHIDDEVAAILHLLDNADSHGVYNLTAPGSASNLEFSRALGRALHRPAVLPMPAFAIRLMLGREAAALLIEGTPVLPERLLQEGFQFRYTDLDEAMRQAVR